MEKYILTINGGSSSIKFALHFANSSFAPFLSGKIERIGFNNSTFSWKDNRGGGETREISTTDFGSTIEMLNSFLESRVDFAHVVVLGHRIVHGMNRKNHEIVTHNLVAELKSIVSFAPEHLPHEIAIIEIFERLHPMLLQVACFDTVFHHELPRVAQVLPLPRKFEEGGLRRYGFHGLSCESIMGELKRLDPIRAEGKVIIAHLGNGASITATKNGKSFDTSMGFTPTGGIPMSTRTGDMDPSAILYLMKKENLSPDAMNQLANHESGLLGVSETSGDMQELLSREDNDERAREAIQLFCYEVKKKIGAYAAAMGGVETIVFTGGMGEQAPRIRYLICEGLEFLDVKISEEANKEHREIISSPNARVCVRVVHTNEEVVMARIAHELFNKKISHHA